MFLNRFNEIKNTFNENTQNFLNELKEEMDNPKKDDLSLLDKIQSENKVSIGTKNKMDSKMDGILKEYANETSEKGDLYFLVEKQEFEYVVYKYEPNDDSVLKINEEDLPENAFVNSALRFIDGKYTIDQEATQELENRIISMANEVIEEQNKILEEYRKEGHLYKVSENINGAIFLHDITDNSSFEVEEVDFPEELKEKAIEGVIFEFVNGEYKLKGEEV